LKRGYAVLHDPVYREKYTLISSANFRDPVLRRLLAVADWGRELMGCTSATRPSRRKAQRTDVPDDKARKAGQTPKALLKPT